MRLKTIARNLSSNLVLFLVNIATTLLLTPFVIATLGSSIYGMWIFLTSLTGYYGLLDLGFRAGLTQILTRHHGENNQLAFNKSASSGFVLLSACAWLLIVISVAAAFLCDHWVVAPAVQPNHIFWAVLIVGLGTAAQFFCFPFSAVLAAHERFDLANGIEVVCLLLRAVLTLVLLKTGWGLLGLAIATSAANLLDYVTRVFFAYRVFPGLRLSRKLANRQDCKAFLSAGVSSVLIRGSRRIIFYSDALVIKCFMPFTAVARYSMASNIVRYYDNFFQPMGNILLPAAASMDARGDKQGVRKFYAVGTVLMLGSALVISVNSCFFAHDFYRIYLNEKAVGEGLPAAGTLYCLLAIGATCMSGQRVGFQVLLGKMRQRLLANVTIVEAVCNLILSLVLVRSLGLVGVALGTAIPSIIFQLFVFPIFICRHAELSWWDFASHVYSRCAVIGGGLAITLMLFKPYLPVPKTWAMLGFQGALFGLVGLGLIALVGLQKEHRLRIWNGLRRVPQPKPATLAMAAPNADVQQPASGTR